MIKHDYNIKDARCEVKELIQEGESFHTIYVFLNDLARGGDIEWNDVLVIMKEMLDGKHGKIDCSLETIPNLV